MRSSRRYRVPPMPFSLSAAQLADLVHTVRGIRAVQDLPMPRGRGWFFGKVFPVLWQLSQSRNFAAPTPCWTSAEAGSGGADRCGDPWCRVRLRRDATRREHPKGLTPEARSATSVWLPAAGSLKPRRGVHRHGMMRVVGTELSLHPDRLLPPEPRRQGYRPPALRCGGRAAADIPARTRGSATSAGKRPISGSGDAVDHTRPLRDPAAARRRRRPCRARRRTGSALGGRRTKGVAAAVRTLGCLPRHGGAVLARRRAGGNLRRHRSAVGGDGPRDLRPDSRASSSAGVPPPRVVRAVQPLGARHHRRPI